LSVARHEQHLTAIYGYARLVDQIGDEVGATASSCSMNSNRTSSGSSTAPRRSTRCCSGSPRPVRECNLPREPFIRLIEANRRDQRTSEYDTFDELVEYCDLSANPVGELVLHVFEAATPERVALSDRVCTALQLVEHWQDVGEDFRRGRIYLPAEDRERFGVQRADLGG
jgi:phytoene/squalene synthetase